MTLIVSLDIAQETNAVLGFASVDANCVARPLAMGADENAAWFEGFYKDQWRTAENPQFGSSGVLAGARSLLRPLAKVVKGQSAGYTNVDNYELDSINLFTILKPYLPHPACTVLEVGCGPGYKMLPFLRDGHACVGIEPSRAMSLAAKDLGVRTVNSPVRDSPEIRDAFRSADVVLSNHSLEHHWNPRVLIELAARYMKPNAAFSLSVPNGQAGFALLQNVFILHLDCYSIDSLEQLLLSFGFKCVYKSVGTQLRVVAVKGEPDAELTTKRTVFDAQEFRTAYERKFLRELGVHDVAAGAEFDIECRGARQFRGLDYEVSTSSSALGPGAIRLKGRVSARSGECIVDYANEGGKSVVLVK